MSPQGRGADTQMVRPSAPVMVCIMSDSAFYSINPAIITFLFQVAVLSTRSEINFAIL